MEGVTALAPRTLCVFVDAPVDSSLASRRWRRLAHFVCSRGPATVVVIRGAAPDELSRLAAELGAEVVELGPTRPDPSSVSPSRPPACTDIVAARAAIAAHLQGNVPDIVWCAGAEAWLALPKPLRHCAVVDLIDPPSRHRRQLARVLVHRLGRRITHDDAVDASVFELTREVAGGARTRAVERHVARKAAAAVVATRPDVFRRGLRCVPTGVDDPGAVCAPVDPRAAPNFVFSGSFLHPSHQDGAEWFALYALPPLRRLLPLCRVVFAGECPDWMWSFGEMHAIEVTGPLGDLGTVIDGGSVVVAPIRAGPATMVEVVEAWARGVPVVATSRAVEGLDAHDGDDVLIADDPAEFAASCSIAARYPEQRARLAANGRARYEAEFTWPSIGAEMLSWLPTLGR